MIIRHHGVLVVLVTLWMLTAAVYCAQNSTERTNETSLSQNSTTSIQEDISKEENANELIKSRKRAHLFDTAESSPWVRVYNRPPGTKVENFFNYETRGNTSALTSGEGWDYFKTNSKDVVIPIDRKDIKTKAQDILRVKPKVKEVIPSPKPIVKDDSQTKQPVKTSPTTTKAPLQTSSLFPGGNDTQKKGYIAWSSNNGGPSRGWTIDDPKGTENRRPPSVDALMPKDGSQWKVIGEGGDDGWKVIDDKGDVEWKIEYDDGEWKVTSTGDVPVDAEWVDPEYVWGSEEGPLSEDDEYNSWPADDYSYSPWVNPAAHARGIGNQSWPKSDYGSQGSNPAPGKASSAITGVKSNTSEKDLQSVKEPIRFGARYKTPEKDTSSAQERTDEESNDTADDGQVNTAELPQADQEVIKGKSWIPGQPAGNNGQKWIQGYGSKTWEIDNTGWNSGFGGETWITANKDFPAGSWVPKSSPGQVQDTSGKVNAETDNSKQTENPIRAWGTGYGSKTWKGNEWDSNIVWKTGFGGALPWTNDSNAWKFPDQDTEDDTDQTGKKAIVWSQPIPSEDSESISSLKTTKAPSKVPIGVKIKWPTRASNIGNRWKAPPSEEDESWGDDSSEGSVIWKGQKTESNPTTIPIGSLPPTSSNDLKNGWQTGDWKIDSQVEEQKSITPPWRSNAPQKNSNLISVKWKADETIPNVPPPVWNQGQWFGGDPNTFPAWIFGGCKMAIKCGSTENDMSDDSSDQNTPPITSYETPPTTPMDSPQTTLLKGWPIKQFKGKSWEPPTKSWKPPPTKSWKPPPTKSWRPPKKSWKPPTLKPTASPTITDTPSTTIVWTEPTVPSSISWPPSPIKWKKLRPRPNKTWKSPPNKNWKPYPTKSWKPPPSSKTWQPSIATPAPDIWSTPTKPDCKDATEMTWSTSEPNIEENDDGIAPPQIIIISKLPNNPKLGPFPQIDKGDIKDDTKIKPPGKSWTFPARKGGPKVSKNRKDKISGSVNKWPTKPKKMSKPGNKYKGRPKSLPPQKFFWPGNSMRRWTTTKPTYLSSWIPPKYMKSKTWKQMLKKWMSG